jgi:glycosyltransferase involved in cell wall biosynthesis
VRIGLDVRYISHGLTGGVRTYVYHLARELPRAGSEHEFIYYADSKAPFELEGLPGNVVVRTLPWRSRASTIVNDLRIGHWMDRDDLDLAHCPGNYGPAIRTPLIITLHDALNLFPMRQHLRGFGKRPQQIALMAYLGRRTRASLRHAARIVTISRHAQQDIAARSGFPLERIDIVYTAAAAGFTIVEDRDALDDCRRRHQLPERFVLADGIKNPAATIAAWRALPDGVKASVHLVFFSRERSPRPAVAHAVADARIRFIAQPPTSDLVALMNLATVFMFPSWYEGFGLPLVEAMNCGLPIVASSRAAIPEVVGDAGLVSDLERPDRLAADLLLLLADEGRRQELRQRALARGATFTWTRTARQMLDVYKSTIRTTLRQTA